MKALAQRLAHSALLLLGVSFLTFLLAELAPGDALSTLRLEPDATPETLATWRARHGLDRPLPLRYLRWLGGVVRGDLGISAGHGSPVATLLWPRARNTLLLTVLASGLAWLVALPLGVAAAARPGGLWDRLSLGSSALLLAVPELLLGLGGLLYAVHSGHFPTGGMAATGAPLEGWARLADLAHHLVLPVAALTLAGIPRLLRHVRSAMVEALDAPFVRAARAHGIPRRRLVWRYGLRAAANPLITLAGFSVAALLSGSLVIEVIFGWPGLGPLLLAAMLARDLQLVAGAALLSSLFLIGGHLLADGLLALLDPRIGEAL